MPGEILNKIRESFLPKVSKSAHTQLCWVSRGGAVTGDTRPVAAPCRVRKPDIRSKFKVKAIQRDRTLKIRKTSYQKVLLEFTPRLRPPPNLMSAPTLMSHKRRQQRSTSYYFQHCGPLATHQMAEVPPGVQKCRGGTPLHHP